VTIAARAARPALPAAVIAVQVVSAYLVLGLPDLRAAADFLTSTVPTMAGSIAAAQVVLWAALLVALGAALWAALRGAVGPLTTWRGSAVWSGMVLAVGILILVTGAVHHASPASVMLTGGSLQEARAELAR
jgi:hypothetical protein